MRKPGRALHDGRVFDVAVDLRRDSPTFRQWVGAPLTPKTAEMLVIPPGCAHGYLTLAANSEVFYQCRLITHHARWRRPVERSRVRHPVARRRERNRDRDRDYPDFKP